MELVVGFQPNYKRENTAPGLGRDPVQKEQVESDQRTLKCPGIPACRQVQGPMWESFLLQAQTKLLIRKNTVHPRSSCAL